MINRILIRVKVIQILYSYLLIEKRFALENNPSSPTKEKRFAYSLYLDFLVLLIKIAESVERRKGDRPLFNTKFITRLLLDDTIRLQLRKYEAEPYQLRPAIDKIVDVVKESGIYKKFIKEPEAKREETFPNFWKDLFNLVIVNEPALRSLIENRPNYTLKAFERAEEMVNRSLVNFLTSQDNVKEVEKSLAASLDKARELYLRLMLLPVELTDLEDRRIDEARHKYLKNESDINPNMRFVDNRIVAALRKDPELHALAENGKMSWTQEDPLMMRNLLKAIKESDLYFGFMNGPENNLHEDAELWRSIFKQIILCNQGFLESMEEKSVFWNDDLEIMTTFVLKGLRRLEDGDTAGIVLDKFKDEEDARFGGELIRYIYRDKDNLKLYINDALEGGNWDQERLALMDVVIILAALAEIMNFPKIPLQVSINEYIELAKSYSGAKSGQFVHGLLGAIVNRLQKEGKLLKR